MKFSNLQHFLVLVSLLLLLGTGAVLLAQTSAGFDLTWHVVGSGGGESASASYQVQGTVGQSLAGPPDASSASFTVSSGYWVGETSTIYLPLITKK